ncbi:hypothetical protein GOB82_02105 [Acetobacter farinalis]|nr:hypothetical protein [Acetobacter farinalis]
MCDSKKRRIKRMLMRIVCPSCGVAYQVPAALLEKRHVLKCSACGVKWRLQPPAEAPAAEQPQAQAPVQPSLHVSDFLSADPETGSRWDDEPAAQQASAQPESHVPSGVDEAEPEPALAGQEPDAGQEPETAEAAAAAHDAHEEAGHETGYEQEPSEHGQTEGEPEHADHEPAVGEPVDAEPAEQGHAVYEHAEHAPAEQPVGLEAETHSGLPVVEQVEPEQAHPATPVSAPEGHETADVYAENTSAQPHHEEPEQPAPVEAEHVSHPASEGTGDGDLAADHETSRVSAPLSGVAASSSLNPEPPRPVVQEEPSSQSQPFQFTAYARSTGATPHGHPSTGRPVAEAAPEPESRVQAGWKAGQKIAQDVAQTAKVGAVAAYRQVAAKGSELGGRVQEIGSLRELMLTEVFWRWAWIVSLVLAVLVLLAGAHWWHGLVRLWPAAARLHQPG